MKGIFFSVILSLLFISFLTGCMGTTYTSRIKDEPLNIDPVFRDLGKYDRKAEDTGGGIWRGEANSNILFSDWRARSVGDILTVKIVEVSQAKELATTDTGRNSEIDAGITGLFGQETKYPARHVINKDHLIAANTKNNFSGTGETKREGFITTTMSAKVVEVLANGCLAVDGKREISVNNERKEILLQGIVRPSDIASDNSVLSTQIADAKIIMTGIGVVGEKQNPGWFTRIFDLIWPF